MAEKRSSRQIAEKISQKILEHIAKKQEKFLKAAEKNDIEKMFMHQLTEAEEQFVQQQQRLDQEADHLDAQSGYLADMSQKELDNLFETLSRGGPLKLPPLPDLTDEEDAGTETD